MKTLVSVYKSPNKDEMYLYLNKVDGLQKVPEELLKAFGKPTHVMDLLLTPEKTLARVDVSKVLNALQENGYYLQMPPAKDEYIEILPDELLTLNDPL